MFSTLLRCGCRALPVLLVGAICTASVGQTAYVSHIPTDLQPYAGEFLLPTGDRIVVEVQDDGLNLAAHGEKAAGILLYGNTFQDNWLYVFRQFNRRASSSLRRLISEGMPTFRADFDPALGDEMSNEIANTWVSYIEMVGQPQGVNVLGSVPDTEGISVFASIHFEKTQLTWKISYSLNRMIEDFTPVTEKHPINLRVVPIAPSTFSGTAFDKRSEITVEFTFDSNGVPDDLRFVGLDESILAERVASISDVEMQKFVGTYTFADGSLLRVDCDQKQLRATGVGQEAFAHLYLGRNLTASERARMSHINERVEDLLEPLLRGAPQEFKKSVNSIGRGAGSGPILQQWQECTDRHGTPRGLNILGAIPTVDDPVCYLAVTFDRTPVVYRVTLTPDLTVGDMQAMISMSDISVVLSPIGDGMFAGCAADQTSPLRLCFTENHDGQMTLEPSEFDTSIATGIEVQNQ